jgi:tRNA(Ile)-lysidine synthase
LSDPSNRNPAFERARLRLDEHMGNVDQLTAELHDFGRQRIERERALDRLLASAVTLHPAGFAVVDPAAIGVVDTELAERLLGRIAACVGGAPYPLRRERVARLRAGLLDRPDRARTLGGCRFVPWRGKLLVLRELAGAAQPVRLEPGAELVWDRRFAVSAPIATMPGLMLGYLGQSGAIGQHRSFAERKGDALPRLVHPVLPALWDAAGLVAVRQLGYLRAGAAALPRISFRPANPLTHAGFTVV